MTLPKQLAKVLWGSGTRNIREFTYNGTEPPEHSGMNDLEQFFWSNSGPVIHKWLHYFDIYDRYFSAFRGTPVRFLEIGVSKGGSLDMWRNYFGPCASSDNLGHQ